MVPKTLTRPKVGFRPTVPHRAEGTRIDPPVSVPIEAAHRPAAIATAEPALDPPEMRSSAQGLCAGP